MEKFMDKKSKAALIIIVLIIFAIYLYASYQRNVEEDARQNKESINLMANGLYYDKKIKPVKIGMSEDDLLTFMGVPDKSIRMPDGLKLYLYGVVNWEKTDEDNTTQEINFFSAYCIILSPENTVQEIKSGYGDRIWIEK